MDVKQLNYFCTIVQEGSVSAAARKLYMSQPPLSYQMKSLEEELGCALFIRGNKNITLTSQGEILYKRAEKILNMIDSTMTEIKNINSCDTIRIGVVSSIINDVGKLLALYEKNNSNIIWEIIEGNTYELVELLKQQSISLAIVRRPFSNNNFKTLKLSDDHLVAVGKNLPEKVDLKYLSDESLIVYRRWIDVIHEQFKLRKLDFSYRFLSDDARTCLSLAQKDLGIALVPFSSISDINGLCISEINDCEIRSAISLIYLPEVVHNDNLESFIGFIKKNWK